MREEAAKREDEQAGSETGLQRQNERSMVMIDLTIQTIIDDHQCFSCPSSSLASNANATMMMTPPPYVAIDGTSPKTSQSAIATKNTLKL